MAYVGFKKLKGQIKGAKDPGAVVASIGRKKYGKKKFQKAAAEGKKMKGEEPQKHYGVGSIAEDISNELDAKKKAKKAKK